MIAHIIPKLGIALALSLLLTPSAIAAPTPFPQTDGTRPGKPRDTRGSSTRSRKDKPPVNRCEPQGRWCPNPDRGGAGSTLTGGTR